VKPNDIISAWLTGVSIWALMMLGLVMAEQSEAPVVQAPPSHGITVDDWYAEGLPDEEEAEAEAIWESDWDWDDPSDRRRSTFLPPFPPPGSQQGADNQQNDKSSWQQ